MSSFLAPEFETIARARAARLTAPAVAPLEKRPWVLPQFAAGTVPRPLQHLSGLGRPAAAAVLVALTAKLWYDGKLGEQVEGVADSLNLPTLLNLPADQLAAYEQQTAGRWLPYRLYAAVKRKTLPWWRQLKFGEDDHAAAALFLTPASAWFMRHRFALTSTARVRTAVGLALPLYVFYSLAPVFFQRFFPDCPAAFKQLAATSPVPELLATARLIDQTERQFLNFVVRDRRPAAAVLSYSPSFIDQRPVLHQAKQGALFFADCLRIFTYFPWAIFSYYWVDGAQEKYHDEYRAFLLARDHYRNK